MYIKTKLLALACMLLLCVTMPSLHAKHHTLKITIKPLGYSFHSSYKIYLTSEHNAPPLRVQLWTSYPPPPYLGRTSDIPKWHVSRFMGSLRFMMDKKESHIGFTDGRHNTLKIKRTRFQTSSIWYAPIRKILENVHCYDAYHTRKRDLPPSTPISTQHSTRGREVIAPFRIVPSQESRMNGSYALDAKSHSFREYPRRRIDISINKEKDAKNKTAILTATATFYPYRNFKISNLEATLKYQITKKGLKEIERQQIGKHCVAWCKPAKEAVQHLLKIYFKLKHAHKKLQLASPDNHDRSTHKVHTHHTKGC